MPRQSSTFLPIRANLSGLCEITEKVRSFATESGIQEGRLTLFFRRTSTSLVGE